MNTQEHAKIVEITIPPKWVKRQPSSGQKSFVSMRTLLTFSFNAGREWGIVQFGSLWKVTYAVSSNTVSYHSTQCRIIQHSAVSSSNRLASPEIQLKVLKDAHKWKSSYFIKRKCSKNLSLIYHCKKRVSLPLFLPLIAPLRSWCFYLPTLFLCSSPSLSPHPLSPPCLLFIKQDALLRRSDLISPLHCLLFAYQAGFSAKPFPFYQAGRITP